MCAAELEPDQPAMGIGGAYVLILAKLNATQWCRLRKLVAMASARRRLVPLFWVISLQALAFLLKGFRTFLENDSRPDTFATAEAGMFLLKILYEADTCRLTQRQEHPCA